MPLTGGEPSGAAPDAPDRGPVVAVVLTTHRTPAPLLGKALGSLLDQTLADLEVVVVCDGDPGAAQEDELAVAGRDPRVRILRPGRVGRGAALGLGLEATTAAYVAIQDADDASHRRRLEWQVRVLDAEPDLDVVGSRAHRTRDQDALADWALPPAPPRVRRLDRRLLLANPLVHSSILARRDAVLAAGGYDPDRTWQLDHDLYLRIRRAGGHLGVLDVPLVLKRLHPAQAFESAPPLPRLWSSYRLQLTAAGHEPIAWRPILAVGATVRFGARLLRSVAARLRRSRRDEEGTTRDDA